jgi:alkanesulfonate monooxygenase SsuD/methylene tetrahydromethanopterin reductase-like flavin-dependent oxidoreductase (luciferase family)
VVLADRLGIDHAWAVEHHFLEEYSHNSAPEVFPPLVPNERGVSRFVYGYTTDRMRRVSRECTIGAAEKDGKRIGAYFILTRTGPA